jgi:hypothetical protein
MALAPTPSPPLSIAAGFLVHLGCGLVYARFGLFAAVLVHLALASRYLLHVAVGC